MSLSRSQAAAKPSARITDALRDRAEADPNDPIAVDLGTGRLTAAQADHTADALAEELDALPGPGLVVARLANSLAAVPVLAGVLRSRHALVLVHPEIPLAAFDEVSGRLRPTAEIAVAAGVPRVRPTPYGPVRPIWTAPAAVPALSLALGVLTSGTTGRPRLIAAPHRQILAAVARIEARLGYRSDDIVPVVSPLSFDYGLYQVFLAWRAGATPVLDPQLGTVANVLVATARTGATVLPLVPPMLNAVASSPMAVRVDTARVRLVTTTGDLLTEADVRAAAAVFPNAEVIAMYGLSECKRVAIAPCGEPRPPGAVGRALDGTDAVVVSATGLPVPVGAVGELGVVGPHLTLGYLADEAATAQRFTVDRRNGARMLHTGDRLRGDEDGWLYWVGRSDDLIKTSGYRVDPAEIETAAAATGLVAECGAYGRPDTARGQVPVLRLRVHDGAAPTVDADLRSALRASLPAWAVPQLEVTGDELPRTRNGKIDRAALAAGASHTGDRHSGPGADTPRHSAPILSGNDPSSPILAALAALPRSSNMINCHTQAVHSAYGWSSAASDSVLFELATSVPFGSRSRPEDPNRLLIPWLDPDIGLDRAAALFGLRSEVRWHDDFEAARARLRRWLRTGPVLLGPLDLGALTYHAFADTLKGCDHYIVAIGTTADETLVLIDPEGYVQVNIDSAALYRAWRATTVAEGRGAFMLRRFEPSEAAAYPEPHFLVRGIASAALANLRDAADATDGSAAGYRTLARADFGPSERRGLFLLLPSAAGRARLAAGFAALVADLLPEGTAWRQLADLWHRQVATLARAHHALGADRPVAPWFDAAAELEHELVEAAVEAAAPDVPALPVIPTGSDI